MPVVQASVKNDTAQLPDLLAAPHVADNVANYEQSVTDKENTLINSFSNLIVNNHSQVTPDLFMQHQTSNGVAAVVPKSNGKSVVVNFDTVNEDDDVLLLSGTNGAPLTKNGNGHTEHSLDNKM